jgi:hypothetical protein
MTAKGKLIATMTSFAGVYLALVVFAKAFDLDLGILLGGAALWVATRTMWNT